MKSAKNTPFLPVRRQIEFGAVQILFDKGINSVNEFFGSGFSKSFDVYVHPSRLSLDSTWQKDWQMPEFKSECWMVASGTHNKLDLISTLNPANTNMQMLIRHSDSLLMNWFMFFTDSEMSVPTSVMQRASTGLLKDLEHLRPVSLTRQKSRK
jgi:hypothetical protein